MLRSLVRFLIAVRATDPIRRMLNRGLAIAIAVWFGFTLVLVVAYVLMAVPPYYIVASTALLPSLVLVWWLNRRYDAIGAAVVSVLLVLAILATAQLRVYFTPWGEPIVLDITLFAPVMVAAFFWRPAAGVWITLVEIVVLCGAAYVAGVAQDAIVNFAVFGTLTLVPITLMGTLLAWVYRSALRRAVDLIPEKGETLDLILASFGDHPDRP